MKIFKGEFEALHFFNGKLILDVPSLRHKLNTLFTEKVGEKNKSIIIVFYE